MATRGISSPAKRSFQISRIGGGSAQNDMLFVEDSKFGITLSCTSLFDGSSVDAENPGKAFSLFLVRV